MLFIGCGPGQNLAPDLAFNFHCTTTPFPESEAVIENFLTRHGFTAFNEERVRRRYKLSLYPLQIDGYDGGHRMLDFRGINDTPSDEPIPTATLYSVGLYTPPPTRHDTALEAATLDFVVHALKCDVSNVSHGDNGADRRAFFDKVYRVEQDRIAAGRKCDRAPGAPLDTHCAS